MRAVGSVVEHRLHTAGVTGSNPVPRTTQSSFGLLFCCPVLDGASESFATEIVQIFP